MSRLVVKDGCCRVLTLPVGARWSDGVLDG